jgi:hypothetical protein
MRLRHQRLASKVTQHLRVRGCPLVQVLGKVGEQIRRKERSGHLSVIPLRRDISIEVLLVGVRVQVHPVGVAPNVNVTPVGDRPDQGGFAAPIFTDKKSHWSAEDNPLGEMKDFVIEGIIVPGRIFLRVKYYFLEMHDKIP